ncbi:MAG: SbcC/MukB-like Walker B domain-containing protein [Sedimentibacter sp.]|uniref:AAA family ATPase n=1 Tax=Sedimentibacter sp. TaxID=1960295 RepID=UPI0031589172
MIPVYLSFQAFGPYVKKQEIEFSNFENSGVFLIHGITGSGKTTILDAITYALYGKSSGGQRGDITAMRCQMAKEDIPTEVDFIFRVAGKTYRFTRTINIRTKRNGTKEYSVTQNAMYEDRNGIFIPFFENPKIKDVEQKACSIIGLNHEQFIQVIMLPQGKFEKLLVAKSEEKEEILVTLFNAQKWQEAAEWICSRAKDISRDISVKREGINVMLKTENAETTEDLIAQAEHLSLEIAATAAVISGISSELEQKKTNLQLQNDLFGLFEEMARTEKELKIIREQENTVAILSSKLEKGRKAISVEQKYSLAMSAHNQFKEASARLENEKQKNSAYALSCEKLQASLEELKKGEERIEMLRENKIKTENLADVYRQITSSRAEADAQGKTYEEMKSQEAAKQDMLAAKRIKLKQYAEKKEYIFNNYSVKLPELREKFEKLKVLDKKSTEIDETKLEIQKIEIYLKKLKGALEKNRTEVLLHKEKFDRAYSGYIRQTAFLLSENLEDGLPCPVCGSIHHPMKAEKSAEEADENLISEIRAQLDSLNGEAAELNNQIAVIDASKSSKAEKLQGLEEERHETLMSLGNFRKEDILSELKTAQDEAGKLNTITQEHKRLAEETDLLEKELSTISLRLTEQSRLKEESAAAYNSLCSRKIEGIEDEAALNKRLSSLKKEIMSYEQELSLLSEKKLIMDKDLSSSNAKLKLMDEDLQAKTAEYENKKAEYLETLMAYGFADTQEFKQCLASQDTLDEWDKKVQNYIIEKGSVEKNLERLSKLTQNKEKPDIEYLKKDVLLLESKLKGLEKQSALQNDKKSRFEKTIRRIEKEQQLLLELIRKYDSYNSFGVTLRGDKGISLRRYVLGVMLSSVTAEANRLLKNVHDGRYQLCRTLEGSGRARKAGLELEVFDGYSGEKRSVSGLSGGEKFLVSLALSLGLSAVVQAQSGGIKIDTMFIDEGFGSLDTSSIGDAMNILGSVKGSKRLVGIISHVQLLKETIESSITVQKDRNGSTLLINN